MVEIAALVWDVVKCLVNPIRTQLNYLLERQSNFNKLDQQVKQLKDAEARVKRKVSEAQEKLEEIEENVENWQDRVKETIDDAEKFIRDGGGANNRCFKGLCPNLIIRRQLSKQALEKLDVVKDLLQKEEKFNEFSHKTRLEEIWLTSDKDYEAFDSRKAIIKNILDDLNNANVHMIGVFGTGGVGKTMLVKEVARQAMKGNLFDKVVFAEVSDTPNITKIQDKIAEELGLEFNKESERARKLRARLKNEKNILIILDNIWKELDFEKVGIPSEGDHMGCKILLTARDCIVLESMGCKTFSIGFLTEREAWSLFKKVAGDYIENRDIKTVATSVLKECEGLPVAIVPVGKRLINKNVSQWKNALLELRRPSPRNFEGVLKMAYSKIEFSYNHLRNEELKKTFLLCSQIGFTSNVLVADLLKYGLGLDLFASTTSMEEARCRVYALVSELKDSCLLLDSYTNELFSMHDVVRDVALSIASRDEHLFSVRNDVVPREWPNKATCAAISLSNCDIGELPEGPLCPQLKFFFMKPKNRLLKIPEDFFTRMVELRVLDLTAMQLLSLPSSLRLLVNIRTLCLDQCVLGDIALIGNLKKLEILSFLKSDIQQLPEEIAQLTKLRMLDLTDCYKLEVIPPKVLSSLSQLEELYMGNTRIQWEIERLNVERSNASLDELHLSNLTTLEICLKDDNVLPKNFFSTKLERYKILIGDEWNWFTNRETSRTLKLKLNSSIFLEELQGIRNVEDLYLDELQGVKNVLYELDEEGFSSLKYLHVQNNPNLLCIVDSKHRVSFDAFPVLESLFLKNLINLEKICDGLLTTQSFCNLRTIKVKKCQNLKNIFSFSIAKYFVQLQTIEVIECKNMEDIFAVGRKDDFNIDEVIDKIEFTQFHSLTLKHLPLLTSFCSNVRNRLKQLTIGAGSNEIISEDELETHTPTSLFNEKVVFTNLEALELSGINFEKIWPKQLAGMSVQKLTRLNVQNCNKMKYMFSPDMVRNFVQLQRLEISNCAILEEIITKEGAEEDAAKFVFPQLISLKLYELPEFRSFYPGRHISEWPVLKQLEVYRCDNAKIFGSESFSFQKIDKESQLDIPTQQPLFLIEKIFPNLEELTLPGKDLRMIWQNQFPEDMFLKLNVLLVENDESTSFPLSFLQMCHNVEELVLSSSSYEEIFSCEEVKETKQARTLTRIKVLALYKLSNMVQIWNQDSDFGSSLHNLEVLDVKDCDKLINLVPSSASFRNLTALCIQRCNGLMNLITPSIAKSLVQLTEMSIYRCKMMTEILANETADAENDEIVFRKLELLALERLESVTSFCSSNCTLKFPSLEDLTVRKCPNMKIFSQGNIIAEKLQQVWLTVDDNEGCWKGDLNTTIRLLHKKMANEPAPEDEEDSVTSDSEEDDEEEDEEDIGEEEDD